MKLASKKRKTLLSPFYNSKIIALFLLIIIVIILPVIIVFLKQHQIYKQEAASPTCNDTGVSKDSSGNYVFAKLAVDSNGNIVDANNPTCIIYLLGLNLAGTFLGNAQGTTNLTGLLQYFQFFTQNTYTNIARVNYNSAWWINDVYVPDAHMHYKAWMQSFIKIQEQAGHYVMLDTGPQFNNPPCGNDGMGVVVNICPAQNQAQRNIPLNPMEQTAYEPVALQGLTELSKIYANDPAILYDIMNEPLAGTTNTCTATNGTVTCTPISEATFMQDMNERINAVRQNTPSAIIIVFERALNDIMGVSGQSFPNFTQGNIGFDSHIYATTSSWNQTQTAQKVAFAHKNGEAYFFNEWGAKSGQPDPATMTAFLSKNGVESAYFTAGDLITGNTQNPGSLNSIGQAVAAGYKSIFGMGVIQTSIVPSTTSVPSISVIPSAIISTGISPTKHPEPSHAKENNDKSHDKDGQIKK